MQYRVEPNRLTWALVLPDIHYPVEDRQTMKAVEAYMASRSWDHLIYLGDVADFNCISEHNSKNLRAVVGQKIRKDYDYINARLNHHAELVGKHCRMTWIQGNHDERVERLINLMPVFEGQLELRNNIDLLKSGRITWVPFWTSGESLSIGKATFIHGRYANEFHAKKHVERYGRNVFYGHLHDFQSYPKVTLGDNETRIAQSLGCLCKYQQNYLHGTPTKWQQGFAVFMFQPNGFFNYYPVMIFNHKFVGPDGKVYTV